MYLCIRCYYDACLKSSAWHVVLKPLHNTMVFLLPRNAKSSTAKFFAAAKLIEIVCFADLQFFTFISFKFILNLHI